jgi:hypothetical protein
MAVTYEKIATTTISSTTSTVTFSSIPATYTDLILIGGIFRVTTGGNNMSMQINGDTGSSYSSIFFEGSGTAVSVGKSSGAESAARFAAIGGGFSASATEPISLIMQFMSYKNTNIWKPIISRYNQTSTIVGASVSHWRSTSAINQISLVRGSGGTADFGAGSVLTLYGIAAA